MPKRILIRPPDLEERIARRKEQESLEKRIRSVSRRVGNRPAPKAGRRKKRHRPKGWRRRRAWLQKVAGEYYHLLVYHYKRCNRGDLTGEDLDRLWTAQEGRCCYCECALTPKSRVLEHQRPILRGGTNTLANVAWVCWDCNVRKGVLTDPEYLERLRSSE